MKLFYTRALDFLEALDINPDEEDQGKSGWHQIKMMFEGDVCQALQTLIDNNTILPEVQDTPSLTLNTIQSGIKEGVHFWYYCDEILSDLCQLQDEGIHSLNTHINTLINKCRFTHEENKESIKVMLLQHTGKYHEVRDWIHLQNQNNPELPVPLVHCKQLEQLCEQFQEAKVQGRAQLTSLTLASATVYSVHADTVTSQSPKCSHYGFPSLCQLPSLWAQML